MNGENKRERLTTATFIEKARKVHGDRYDYSKVNYINTHTKVCIICPEHGQFYQLPPSHLKGMGCRECGSKRAGLTQSFTTEEWINKARKVHNDKYDYSKVDYKGCHEKICIICPIHGEFWQAAYSHLSGHGCPKCMADNNAQLIISNTSKFIDKAKKIHNEENNDYSQVVYKNAKTPVKIICQNGHEYWQMPNKHLIGHGCPYCINNISKAEKEIADFIISLGFEIETNKRSILNGSKEIDIYIPSKQIAIEFNGLYWHNEDRKPNKNYHLNKTLECEKRNINLIHIFEDEWQFRKEIVKSYLKIALGVIDYHLSASNCEIKEVNCDAAIKFLIENSIDESIYSSIRYGIFHNNEIVSLMTFNEENNNRFRLTNFCNKLNTEVNGSAEKLFNHFVKIYNPENVILSIDRRWNINNLHDELNFQFAYSSPPSCHYIVGQQRYTQLQRNKPTHKIYDCGNLFYEWKNTVL